MVSLPFPLRQRSATMISHSSRISSPWNASPPSTILKPLNSGGLWEPVTCTPPSVSRAETAK